VKVLTKFINFERQNHQKTIAMTTKLKFYSREALQDAVMILDCNLIEWDFVKFEKCGIWEIEIFE
jgi:hypothetical protein